MTTLILDEIIIRGSKEGDLMWKYKLSKYVYGTCMEMTTKADVQVHRNTLLSFKKQVLSRRRRSAFMGNLNEVCWR